MDNGQHMVGREHDSFAVHVDTRSAGAVTLTLVGELDHTGVGPLTRVLARTWDARPVSLTLDLRELDFINARGLGCLLAASRTARRRRVPLVLLRSPGQVSRLLTFVGLGGPVAVVGPVPAVVPDPVPALVLVTAAHRPRPGPPGTLPAVGAYAALVDLDVALSGTCADVAATCDVVVTHLAGAVPAVGHAAVSGPSALAALQARAGEGPTHDARRLREVVHAEDLHRDGRWPRLAQQAAQPVAAGVLAVPLVHEGVLQGVLTLHSDQPDAFDAEVRDLLGALAARAATALGSARIRHGLQQAVRSRDVIGQAKGILMVRFGLTAPQAFALLSRTSQDRNVRLADLAGDLARTGVP